MSLWIWFRFACLLSLGYFAQPHIFVACSLYANDRMSFFLRLTDRSLYIVHVHHPLIFGDPRLLSNLGSWLLWGKCWWAKACGWHFEIWIQFPLDGYSVIIGVLGHTVSQFLTVCVWYMHAYVFVCAYACEGQKTEDMLGDFLNLILSCFGGQSLPLNLELAE